jgi:hypothetical protein
MVPYIVTLLPLPDCDDGDDGAPAHPAHTIVQAHTAANQSLFIRVVLLLAKAFILAPASATTRFAVCKHISVDDETSIAIAR